jgi:hypothetical protein
MVTAALRPEYAHRYANELMQKPLDRELLNRFVAEMRGRGEVWRHRVWSGSGRAIYDAMLLPMACEVYLKLRDKLNDDLANGDVAAKGDATKHLAPYRHIITACDSRTRGLAKRGIIALVDDVTGYQDDKMRQEIDRIIKAYVSPSSAPWVQKFPHAFFREAYRLLGWDYTPGKTRAVLGLL